VPDNASCAQVQSAIKFEGVELCFESSLPPNIKQSRPATDGFAMYTQGLTILAESRTETARNSSFKIVTEMQPMIFFGHIPHQHTMESLKAHAHVGRLKMKVRPRGWPPPATAGHLLATCWPLAAHSTTSLLARH
jgi:hypothetical protein